MKIRLTAILLLVLCSARAFGLGGKLESPSLSHRSDLDANRKGEIHQLLKFMKDDLTFIEGSFINQFSNQRFGGTSAQVSRFIGLLNGVALWEVDVQFRDFGEQESAFTLDGDSAKSHLRVIVNSGRRDFLLRDFSAYLPAPSLPQFGVPKAGAGGGTNGRQPVPSETKRLPSEPGPRR